MNGKKGINNAVQVRKSRFGAIDRLYVFRPGICFASTQALYRAKTELRRRSVCFRSGHGVVEEGHTLTKEASRCGKHAADRYRGGEILAYL